MFDITGEVKHYPYRTAQVHGRILRMDRDHPDVRKFEEELAAVAGVRSDNHTVYTITHDGSTLCVFFHDHKAIFGWTLVEERW